MEQTEARVVRELPSYLDYWPTKSLQDHFDNGYIDVINPLSGFEARDSGSLKFNILGNDSFISLNLSAIYLKLQLVGKAKENTSSAGDVDIKVSDVYKSGLTIVNNIAHSIFSNINVRLGNQLITRSGDGYPFKTYIQLLCNSSKESQDTFFRVTGWKKDTAGAMDDSIGTDKTTTTNKAALARREEFFNADDGIGEFYIRPHTGLTFLEMPIIPYLDIEFELERHPTSDFYLMHKSKNSSFGIKILEARYHVQRFRGKPSLLKDLEVMTRANPVSIDMNEGHNNNFTITSGVRNYSNENMFHNHVPNRIIFAFVRTDAYNGASTKNPFNFQHFKIESLRLMKNGIEYPRPEIITNFESIPNTFMTAYYNTMISLGADYNINAIAITPEEYSNGYYFYSFNMAPDQQISGGDVYTPADRPSQIRLDIRFSAALTDTIQLLVYYENRTTIRWDVERRVSVLNL